MGALSRSFLLSLLARLYFLPRPSTFGLGGLSLVSWGVSGS